ncbi:MAG: FAD:protein FMN transferase [Planctomycetota bacterium]
MRWGGETMGTTYAVTIDWEPVEVDDLRLKVDTELRRVNDQMSTYLKGSEISRFNRSDSTEWFSVSPEFAAVVKAAIGLAKQSDGALDITVGPAVDLWSFGTTKRTRTIPDQAALDSVRDRVGISLLEVREQPPALRKQVADVQIDLSAIAKGHGVDRVIGVLKNAGIEHAFVEIGGEVRVLGNKGGDPWRVGIEHPDPTLDASRGSETPGAATGPPSLLHSFGLDANLPAIATSGDYRNFFEVDGKRYSHTIDPRTLRPVEHELVSVTVAAEDCMMADGWATALNVLGPQRAGQVAEANGLSTILVWRRGEGFAAASTGVFKDSLPSIQERLAVSGDVVTGDDVGGGATEADFASTWVPVFVITALGLGLLLAMMAVGVIFGRKSISGSCGGIAGVEDEDGNLRCSLCDNPADGCRDLREKMREQHG